MSVATAITDNPVLTRELDVRVSGKRGMILVTAWLVLIAGVFLLTFLALRGTGASAVLQAGSIGRQLFDWTLSGMLGLVLLIVPITTAGVIVNERERQTLSSLQLTLMSPTSIILSKLTASIAFVVLLTIAALPLLASCIFIGGVSTWIVLKGVFLVIFTAVVVGAIAILCSSVARRMAAAIVMTLFLVGAMVFGSVIVVGAIAVIDETRGFDTVNPPIAPLVINPVAAVGDITDDGIEPDTYGPESPLEAAQLGVLALQRERARVRMDGPVPAGATRTRLWRWYVVTMSSVSIICVGVAAERVRAPAGRER